MPHRFNHPARRSATDSADPADLVNSGGASRQHGVARVFWPSASRFQRGTVCWQQHVLCLRLWLPANRSSCRAKVFRTSQSHLGRARSDFLLALAHDSSFPHIWRSPIRGRLIRHGLHATGVLLAPLTAARPTQDDLRQKYTGGIPSKGPQKPLNTI